MFLCRNKKNSVYPCEPQFYYIKVGFKVIKIIQVCFRDGYRVQIVRTIYGNKQAVLKIKMVLSIK